MADEDDLALGRPTEEQIRKAIREDCDGAVLWLTNEALKSSFIMDIELRAVVKAAKVGRLSFMPVFVGMAPEDGSQKSRNRLVCGSAATTASASTLTRISPPRRDGLPQQ